jgi:hypothetical protein
MEWEAMGPALQRLFARHNCEFYALPTPLEINTIAYNGGFPLASCTSCDITRVADRPNNADKLIDRAVGAAIGDRSVKAADLVLIIDDLELVNLTQPDAVTMAVRKAAARHLDRFTENLRLQHRVRRALRERVSFHLVKPMIESWLFADPEGPRRSGVPLARVPHRLATGDDEDFQTDDAAFELDTGERCSAWAAMPTASPRQRKRKHKSRPVWVKAGELRRLHPKAYMSWLCTDPDQSNCSSYSETTHGAPALAAIDWEALLGAPASAPFARALVNDIADCLGIDPPFPGHVAACTASSVLPREPVLRNL